VNGRACTVGRGCLPARVFDWGCASSNYGINDHNTFVLNLSCSVLLNSVTPKSRPFSRPYSTLGAIVYLPLYQLPLYSSHPFDLYNSTPPDVQNILDSNGASVQ
jgi:hypothetical protein